MAFAVMLAPTLMRKGMAVSVVLAEAAVWHGADVHCRPTTALFQKQASRAGCADLGIGR